MDILKEEQNIIAIESQLDSLCILANKIELANGMSKSFAMEAIEIMPEFGNNISTAFYSKEPSIIRHTEALEGISNGIWALIVAATVAVIAIVHRFITWLFGGDVTTGKPTVEKLEAIESNAKHTAEFLAELDKLPYRKNKPTTEDMSGPFNNVTGIDDIINNYIKENGHDSSIARALRVEDPLLHDLLYHGDYSKTIKSTNQVVGVLPIAVDNAAKIYLKTVDDVLSHIKKLGNSREDNNPISIDVKPIEIDMFSNGKRITINEGASKLELARQDAASKISNKTTLSFSKLNSLYSLAIGGSSITNILKKIENTKNHMDDILLSLSKANNDLDKLKTHIVGDPISVKYGESLRAVFKVTRIDVLSCFKFFHELMQYANLLQRINTKVVTIQKEGMHLIEKEIKLNHEEIHVEFKVLQKRYNDALSLDFT